MKPHLSDQQLLGILYGISVNSEHLEECRECAGRFRAIERRRAELARPARVSSEFLAAQRRRIYARIGEGRRASTGKWVPAVAAAFLLGIGLLFYRPSVAPPPLHTDTADAQLFSDVYSMEQSSDPPSAAPIHALFEDNQ